MLIPIDSYLKKRGVKGPWKLVPNPVHPFQNIVVIPAYAESHHIEDTLDSLSNCITDGFDKILVVVVVNNEEGASSQIIQDNQTTLVKLANRNDPFHLSIVDAASNGNVIPKKHAGVGMARKIGMDLSLLFTQDDSILFCLDADSLVENTYFTSIQSYFNSKDTVAAVVGFSHSKSENTKIEKAIREYEEFLIDTAVNLQAAGSPYGYVSMGSTIICRATAYAAVGGMPRRKATEDFYFLQELAKYKEVIQIPEILVHPSPRLSERVYLGTGFRMSQILMGNDFTSLDYPDKAFKVLKQWLIIGESEHHQPVEMIIKKVKEIHMELYSILIESGFEDAWKKLQINSPTKRQFISQFHKWFDALKTYRLLNRFKKNHQIFEKTVKMQ